jgi:hypothetical protein
MDMPIRRRVDEKLVTLRALTGLRRRDDLLDLGRIAEDVVDAPAGTPLLVDWLGRGYAVAVLRGSVQLSRSAQLRDASAFAAGDVFVTAPFETVRSLGAVAIVAAARDADRMRELLTGGDATAAATAQPATPAMSSSAAAYGSS